MNNESRSNSITAFPNFIWKAPSNKKYFLEAVGLSVGMLLIFKFFYPDPDFISDSYSYIFGAQANLGINIWPIGYSKFLLLFHHITHSDLALISFQYLLMETAAIYFFFTLKYFYNPSKKSTLILFIFLFCNPLFLYFGNLVNSDALFSALSLFWLTQLIWILNQPKPHQIIVNAFLLFLCFTVRNNAYYYPIVSIIALLLSKQTIWRKSMGILFPFIFIIPFVIQTSNEAYKLTGTHQFSLFTGWQLANNALYAYNLMKVDTTQLSTPQERQLDNLTRQFYKNVPVDFSKALFNYEGNYFIMHSESPLKVYMEQHYDLKDDYTTICSWGKTSVIFSKYGEFLIKHYPLAFFKGFIMVNIKNYFYPPLLNFEVYNRGKDEIWPLAQDWFDWKIPAVKAASKTIQLKILYIFPSLFLFLNVYLIGAALLLLFRRQSSPQISPSGHLLILFVSFLLLNFGFTVLATMNVIRYQMVSMTICFTSVLILSELLEKKVSIRQKPYPTPDVNISPEAINPI